MSTATLPDSWASWIERDEELAHAELMIARAAREMNEAAPGSDAYREALASDIRARAIRSEIYARRSTCGIRR
jgi:hypothetical protein